MASIDILERLRDLAPGLAQRYRLTSMGVFGSVARGEQRPDSDIDVLVTFEGKPNLRRFMGLKLDLEESLQSPVDLATPEDLRGFARGNVDKELIRVA